MTSTTDEIRHVCVCDKCGRRHEKLERPKCARCGRDVAMSRRNERKWFKYCSMACEDAAAATEKRAPSDQTLYAREYKRAYRAKLKAGAP